MIYEILNKKKQLFLLAGLLLLIYGQTIFFEENLDDFLVLGPVKGNIQTFSDLVALLQQPFNQVDYRPVALFTFGLEQLLFGDIHTGVSHAINVLIYFLALVAGLKLLKKLLPRHQHEAAFWAVILIACSTVNTEAVASIKSRDTLFSLLFTFLALQQLALPLVRKNLGRILLGSVFFLVALLAKRDSAGLILFLPMLVLLRSDTPAKRTFLHILAVIVLLFVLYQLRVHFGEAVIEPGATSRSDIGRVTYTENPLSADFSLSNRIAAAFQTNLLYTGKLLFPADLRFYYGYDKYQIYPFGHTHVWLAMAFHLLILTGIFLLGKKNRSLWLSALAYACFILFALNFIEPNAGIVADRYVFQAGIWFWLLVVLLLQTFLPLRSHRPVLLVLTLMYLGISTYRTSAWKNRITLLQRDMPHLSRSFEAQRIAAGTFLEYFQLSTDAAAGRTYLQQALQHARNANRIYPGNITTNKLEGIAAYNLQRYADSRTALNRARQNKPDDPETLELLGDLSFVENDFAQAGNWYSQARKFAPASEILINKLSSAIYATGDKDSCLRFNRQLIESEPLRYAPYENLGYFFLEDRDTANAKKYFELAREKGLAEPAPF